ncbi:alpha/beta fold hydrolase [Frankia sp. Ag45/Mut15]|uniref:Alpha/beta fold hydrolase n=1 Tax=Frankia umida TaxID=573489 RepID=A0ABT0K2X3_9ACTN|nr:alpha/beta fold hydrolase [Frankia umida]MCK9878130.1 alpha/beta fold hydrolase [Frankia umida]
MSERPAVAALDQLDETTLPNEFALLAEVAADAGLGGNTAPLVQRRWFNPTTGGHVSAVVWGSGPPEVVLLHDAGRGARQWDAVILALGRPAVALDLPGHGRSNRRRDGRYEPVRLAVVTAEAIASFAPRARLVVGSGLGGLTALALAARRPELVHRLVLLDTLPGLGRAVRPAPGAAPASRTDAVRLLAATVPLTGSPEADRPVSAGEPAGRSGPAEGLGSAGGVALVDRALRREVLYGTVREPDGPWAWRHDPALAAVDHDPQRSWDHLTAAVSATAVSVVRAASSFWGDDLDEAARRAGVPVLTIDGVDIDAEIEQPVTLARVLDGVLADPADRTRTPAPNAPLLERTPRS